MRHKIRTIHFIGIGGVGMAGLAEVLSHSGYTVSGSDLSDGAAVRRLRRLGISVALGHAAEQVENADCVVYSGAVAADNVERRRAMQRGIPVIPRAQMLGELMRFKPGVAISGTHGKTTVSTLVAQILLAAGWSPTCVIGGQVPALGEGGLTGSGDYVVVEADESDASFLHLQPVLSVVTNIDDDHLETFGNDMERMIDTFEAFLGNLPFYGVAVLCVDDAHTRALADRITTLRCVRYGLADDADIRGEWRGYADGKMEFDLIAGGERTAITLNALGEHNVRNALAAAAVALELGVSRTAIQEGLASFRGVGRRLEEHGEITLGGKTVTLVDDYAHHPTEMTETLKALRLKYADNRLLLIFQPHRFSRTRRLLPSLALAMAMADVVILTDIYPAGEPQPEEDWATPLFEAIPKRQDKHFVESIEAVPHRLGEIVEAGDLLVTMGAGSIGQLPARLKEAAQ